MSENSYQTGPNSMYNIWAGGWEDTQRVGHSVWAILLGLAGGYLAVSFKSRNSSQPHSK